MKKHRVLVVDDEAGFTRILQMNLAPYYEVKIENSSINALPSALEFHPDLILLDVMMPGRDGGELAEAFLAHAQLQKIPIVFLTAAVAEGEVKSHGGLIGGFPFLAKPANIQEIRACIEKHLSSPAAL
jgi:DNA-binding response OmpR family regulator